MKNSIILSILLTIVCLVSCNNTNKNADASGTDSATNAAFYFDFSIDGKPFSIKEEDILTTYNEIPKGKGVFKQVFKIMAGNYGETSLVLTIPNDMTKPSSTPSGSANLDDEISQGSVSLQGYPEKGYTFNSFETTYAERAISVPDAIVVTATERVSDGRIITGTFKAKVFGGDNSKNDPNIKDRIVTGKFRIKHTFRDIKF